MDLIAGIFSKQNFSVQNKKDQIVNEYERLGCSPSQCLGYVSHDHENDPSLRARGHGVSLLSFMTDSVYKHRDFRRGAEGIKTVRHHVTWPTWKTRTIKPRFSSSSIYVLLFRALSHNQV